LQKNKGFTLIELVIVIVILGVLSSVAIPKFINLKGDAVLSSMDSLVGVIESADQLVYMKAAILNVQDESSATITIDGTEIATVYGYPAGTADGIVKVIENNAFSYSDDDIIDGSNGYWYSRESIYTGAWIYWPSIYGENAGSLQCYIRYRQPTASESLPVIDLVTSECD
jgi:MSHA pilin protein MshA